MSGTSADTRRCAYLDSRARPCPPCRPEEDHDDVSRLTDLIAQAKANDPTLGADLEAEIRVLQERRPFGLNFERHQPEAVELPGRPVRKGDKVRVLPPRGETCRGDQRLWRVARIEAVDGERVARLELAAADAGETATALVDDLVVVAEFRDPIYPGLRSTGRVERGGDKPFHTVINAENYHALQTLLYTHRGKVDCIYIDPPFPGQLVCCALGCGCANDRVLADVEARSVAA